MISPYTPLLLSLLLYINGLDYGKILTGKPNQFDGKNIKTMVSGVDFPFNQSIEITHLCMSENGVYLQL